ncbi:hypothetical protein STSP2_01406 [Anaerohalosphaera lusitana]|uniref:Uncharacterized protein n=1 Tax=Anaerohalosphaera lusitana TaxID=1936003 RepID=A0A1U9NKY6_9BACT|nr:hypothetical protein [Anaerohalosphaera lusitana]AQT68250.1 hypothetical protein STSP2_01406 [Anaerohalosphaera lusitana]
MAKHKTSKLKPIVSVKQMAEMLNLSRARFYQLLDEGIFPQPIYDLRTRRPLYDARLQKRCLEVRDTGIGDNGRYILFYSPREKSESQPRKQNKGKTTANLKYQELTETLNSMGLDCSAKEAGSAIEEIYPEGIEHEDEGVVIREIFRYLRQKGV